MCDELVKRQVAVEGVHHPVAVSPGLGQLATGRAGLGVGVVIVGVARHVEPVPSPALAVCRRIQEPVDNTIECDRRLIREERIDLVGRRREAGQAECRPADPCQTIRRRRE